MTPIPDLVRMYSPDKPHRIKDLIYMGLGFSARAPMRHWERRFAELIRLAQIGAEVEAQRADASFPSEDEIHLRTG
jgi:hypothetical protein